MYFFKMHSVKASTDLSSTWSWCGSGSVLNQFQVSFPKPGHHLKPNTLYFPTHTHMFGSASVPNFKPRLWLRAFEHWRRAHSWTGGAELEAAKEGRKEGGREGKNEGGVLQRHGGWPPPLWRAAATAEGSDQVSHTQTCRRLETLSTGISTPLCAAKPFLNMDAALIYSRELEACCERAFIMSEINRVWQIGEIKRTGIRIELLYLPLIHLSSANYKNKAH